MRLLLSSAVPRPRAILPPDVGDLTPVRETAEGDTKRDCRGWEGSGLVVALQKHQHRTEQIAGACKKNGGKKHC